MNIEWKTPEEMNKSGLILALCKDDTGIYNQLMCVVSTLNTKEFYENGTLGSSKRVYPDKIKAGLYLEDICSQEIIDKFCKEKIKYEIPRLFCK